MKKVLISSDQIQAFLKLFPTAQIKTYQILTLYAIMEVKADYVTLQSKCIENNIKILSIQ